jgi:protein PhnA
MSLEKALQDISLNSCELCKTSNDLNVYTLQPSRKIDLFDSLYACNSCISQMEDTRLINPNHWRCLNDSMWSEFLPVQVFSWRMLNRIISEGWPQNLLEMMYLEASSLQWAKALGDGVEASAAIIHRDVNGVVLKAGDSVVLIKDLKVKGSRLVAKQGLAVRRISLDQENENYIEGKVEGQQVVIITQYVKKI